MDKKMGTTFILNLHNTLHEILLEELYMASLRADVELSKCRFVVSGERAEEVVRFVWAQVADTASQNKGWSKTMQHTMVGMACIILFTIVIVSHDHNLYYYYQTWCTVCLSCLKARALALSHHVWAQVAETVAAARREAVASNKSIGAERKETATFIDARMSQGRNRDHQILDSKDS